MEVKNIFAYIQPAAAVMQNGHKAISVARALPIYRRKRAEKNAAAMLKKEERDQKKIIRSEKNRYVAKRTRQGTVVLIQVLRYMKRRYF